MMRGPAGVNSRVRGCGILLVMAMAGCALSAHGQQIYKWVDDKGVTQYTTTPPPGGKAQTIKTAPAPAAPATRTWQEQEIEFRARQVERAEARHEQEQAQVDAARRRAACAVAQQDLRALKEQRPVYRQDEKGERQYLDDPQRAEAERTTRGFIDRECSK
jgi:hypothetical protein